MTLARHHFRLAMAALLCAASACHHFGGMTTAEVTPTSPGVTVIDHAGFDEPENIAYDSVADVFLVSNIVGGPAARDDNGFLSRVSPDGRVLALRWIAGGVGGAVLDAPKGIAIRADTIAVADVGAVHLFLRTTGAPIRTIPLPGVVMNDVAWGPDGSLWVTDTGPDRTPAGTDTSADLDAVWRIAPDGGVRAAARSLALDRPDGIVLDGTGALVTTFGANRIERVVPDSAGPRTIATLPGGRVDGLRRLPGGSLAVTSWDAATVWRITASGRLRPMLTHVTSPAGIAVDTRRNRLAVTSMQGNAMYILPLR